ncbi:batten's disease protein Cln3 [Tilletiopsis washingtonensis]|uniref:Protein BTN n=1 Tax=Tilletiopsis washingtonensis TaxID=58919 RepID=A0A316Z1I3_9BASI|nr:batten's disease protein Cln3 [Tilletiopsis washingtonensis]PWN95226.1 batten's disease protein Cln3 [Tilletiopsis washingtonensis]
MPAGGHAAPAAPLAAGQTGKALRFSIAFFVFGLLNNALYVVILTAAVELLPAGVPTGVVALTNIAPALLAKAVWPYALRGQVRYARRIAACALLSAVGMLLVGHSPVLASRLTGIGIASFSSGLGELTFLQLSTRYGRRAGQAVGWFASGTGAAGLLGAAAWWLVRPLGVALGLSLLAALPLLMAACYLVLLPSREALEGDAAYRTLAESEPTPRASMASESDDDEELLRPRAQRRESMDVAPLPFGRGAGSARAVPFARKMLLLRPMLLVYIAPLVLVYLLEYTINQGIAPTLLYPLPSTSQHPLLGRIIRKLADYYVVYQTTYQAFVFLSRSSISMLRMPAIPRSWLWAPAVMQALLVALLASESLYAWFRPSIASPLVIVLVCVEGLAGGSAYVSVFYHIGTDPPSPAPKTASGALLDETDEEREERQGQEQEFRIGSVGLGDTLGILVAALISMPIEVSLCAAQVASGRTLCREVKS